MKLKWPTFWSWTPTDHLGEVSDIIKPGWQVRLRFKNLRIGTIESADAFGVNVYWNPFTLIAKMFELKVRYVKPKATYVYRSDSEALRADWERTLQDWKW